MNEADINQRIMQLLYALPTVKGQHNPDSRRATCPGFPDWVFIGPNGILFREVKGSNDTLLPHQRAIGRLIMIAGGDWMVWGPGDIARGIAEKQLEEIS